MNTVQTRETTQPLIDEHLYQTETHEHYSPLSKFPRPSIVDDYESQISIPPPLGTIITDYNFINENNDYLALDPFNSEVVTYNSRSAYSSPHLASTSSSTANFYDTTLAANFLAGPQSSKGYSYSNMPNFESTSTASINCTVCGEETSQAHSSPGCFRNIHIICGRLDAEGEEGFGCSVWRPACEMRKKNERCNELILGIKRSQEKLHTRILSNYSKKFKQAQIGDSILIPITCPDKMSSIGPRNLTGCITQKDNELYTIGTVEGTLSNKYLRSQFDICPSHLISPEDVPLRTISQTETMRKASLGIESGSACRCKICRTNRCPCKKQSENATVNAMGEKHALINKQIVLGAAR